MKFAVAFSLLAACLICVALMQGGAYYFALWPAISFIIVAAAYAKAAPGVFAKRLNGTLAWWSRILLLPYLLLTWGLWHVLRLVHREDCCNEVVPGLWLGRRALAHEVPESVDLIVDLTAEFVEPKDVIKHRNYICLPVLDGSVPDSTRFQALVEKTAAWPGKVYIQCASGHGRSATLMAALLIRKGFAKNVEEAIRQIRKARPGIAIAKHQKRFLEIWSQQTVTPQPVANERVSQALIDSGFINGSNNRP